MHARQTLISHRGRSIVVHDYRGISDTEFPAAVRTLTAELMAEDSGSTLLLLDISGCTIFKEVLAEFKKSSTTVKTKLTRTAVVGVEGIQLFFLNVVNTYSSLGVKPFPSREAAVEYLTR